MRVNQLIKEATLPFNLRTVHPALPEPNSSSWENGVTERRSAFWGLFPHLPSSTNAFHQTSETPVSNSGLLLHTPVKAHWVCLLDINTSALPLTGCGLGVGRVSHKCMTGHCLQSEVVHYVGMSPASCRKSRVKLLSVCVHLLPTFALYITLSMGIPREGLCSHLGCTLSYSNFFLWWHPDDRSPQQIIESLWILYEIKPAAN